MIPFPRSAQLPRPANHFSCRESFLVHLEFWIIVSRLMHTSSGAINLTSDAHASRYNFGTLEGLLMSCPRNKHDFRRRSVGCFSRRERRACLNRRDSALRLMIWLTFPAKIFKPEGVKDAWNWLLVLVLPFLTLIVSSVVAEANQQNPSALSMASNSLLIEGRLRYKFQGRGRGESGLGDQPGLRRAGDQGLASRKPRSCD